MNVLPRLDRTRRYHPASLELDCFLTIDNRLVESDDYCFLSYFDDDGYYKGPDQYGIEPIFTADSVALSDMAVMLIAAGERFSGNDVTDQAECWVEFGFTAETAWEWVQIGCWASWVAHEWRDAGLTPEIVKTAAEVLLLSLPDDADPADVYTDGCPIYSCCNDDTDPGVVIQICRDVVRESSKDPSRYRAEFTGRHLGAIGVMESHSVIVEGCDEDDARNKIAEKYQDIRGLVLTPVC